MSNIKVAYILGSLNRGGAETLMLDVFRNAEKAPFEMIGIHRKGGAYSEDFYAAGPKMIQCAPKRFGHIRYLLCLRRLLRKERVSIIHTQYWLDCIYVWLATIGLHIPIVHTFHGHTGAEVNALRSIYYCIVMRIADKLCFVSRYQMNQFASRYNKVIQQKGCVMYNGVDLSKFDRVENSEKVKEKIVRENSRKELKSEGINLCMVGSFNNVRNQKLIVEAMSLVECRELRAESFDFYFVGTRFKGEEWRYDECVRYCKENGLTNVHFLGGRGDIPTLLRQMDGFVYATRNDTFGIAVVEAMAVGLPVVVNDHPVMQEVCGVANAGLQYFRTDDPEDAARTISELLSNLQNSKQAAAENAKVVRDRYSIEKHIQNLSKMYHSLCK